MTRILTRCAFATVALLSIPGFLRASEAAPPHDDVIAWSAQLQDGLAQARTAATQGDVEGARETILRVYLDEFEPLEAVYGQSADAAVRARMKSTEARFHAAMVSSDAAELLKLSDSLRRDVDALRAALTGGSAALQPGDVAPPAVHAQPGTIPAHELVRSLDAARASYRNGDAADALHRIELLYLQGVEPLEARLTAARVTQIERAVHLQLRPALRNGATEAATLRDFATLRDQLVLAQQELSGTSARSVVAANSFLIILREGLEAVLLVAALLAYLGAIGAPRRAHRQIYLGIASGIAASFATWWAARSLIQIGGASRELLEGVTALLAVAVLLYVSNWLFQKTYIHDWKEYLRTSVGRAVSSGSGFAMASLAFAAVYREGFETVLFYQTLVFEGGTRTVLMGALPGLAVILLVGFGIVRAGLKLPLRQVFATTNAILLLLAFSFIGKGLYSLQEAGVFAAHPLTGMPQGGFLTQVFGFYPMVETLAAQLGFVVLIAVTYLIHTQRKQALQLRRQPGRAVELAA